MIPKTTKYLRVRKRDVHPSGGEVGGSDKSDALGEAELSTTDSLPPTSRHPV